MVTKPKGRQSDSDRGYTREARRARMLQQAATFLYSLNEQSDRAVKASGRTRGDLASAQYDFARDLADTITEELKHGS